MLLFDSSLRMNGPYTRRDQSFNLNTHHLDGDAAHIEFCVLHACMLCAFYAYVMLLYYIAIMLLDYVA